MAEVVLSSYSNYNWSSCSRTYFLQNYKKRSCLKRNGKADIERLKKIMITEYAYSRDEQCRQHFGEGYVACNSFNESCTDLYCALPRNESACDFYYSPLPGTSCGKNKWCMNGICETRINSDKPQWGTWEPWKPLLTRTSCGYQLMVRYRKCYVKSSPVRSQLCGKLRRQLTTLWSGQQCVDYQDPRVKMCKDEGPDYIPYEHANPQEHCNLWCVSSNFGDIWKYGQVKNGTPCDYSNSQNLCYKGKCVVGTCSSLDDSCNLCPSGHCHHKTVTLSKTFNGIGWNSIVKIPKGAYNVSLGIYFNDSVEVGVEFGESSYLKLDAHSDDTNRIPFPLRASQLRGKMDQKNLDLERTNNIRGNGRLVVNGQLLTWTVSKTSYVVEVTSQLRTHLNFMAYCGNQYNRLRPSVTYTLNYRSTFEWAEVEWEECSATCGYYGFQLRQRFCVPSNTSPMSHKDLIENESEEFYCDSKKAPIKERDCNRKSCLGNWISAGFTECSVTCGSGISTEKLICSSEKCGKKPLERKIMCREKRCPIQCQNPEDPKICMLIEYLDLKKYCAGNDFRNECCNTCIALHTYILSRL